MCSSDLHLTATNHSIFMNGVEVTYSASNNGTGTYNTDSGNPLAWLTVAGMDHFIIWDRPLSGTELGDLYVEPFRFMMPDQRSRPYQGVAALATTKKPFIFVVT